MVPGVAFCGAVTIAVNVIGVIPADGVTVSQGAPLTLTENWVGTSAER
jgi:hypothetical protein